jgi:hypothetical protein
VDRKTARIRRGIAIVLLGAIIFTAGALSQAAGLWFLVFLVPMIGLWLLLMLLGP